MSLKFPGHTGLKYVHLHYGGRNFIWSGARIMDALKYVADTVARL